MFRKFIKLNMRLSNGFESIMVRLFGKIANSEQVFSEALAPCRVQSARVLELGGSQRPLFDKSEFAWYAGLDMDKSFDWQPHYHQYMAQSCTQPYNGSYSFIFSKYLLEHVDDNKSTYDHAIAALKNDGVSIHFFPLQYTPYSIITSMVGNGLQRKLIKLLRPHAADITGYPVYFDLCNAVSLKKYFKKREDVKVNIQYFYGADEYFAFFFPFFMLSIFYNRFCHFFGIKLLASNAILTIKKTAYADEVLS